MGDVYCVLNHDRKEAFHLGKSHVFRELLGEWASYTRWPLHRFKFKQLVLFDMVKFLADQLPDWRIDLLEKLCKDLIAFEPQDLYEECDDAVLEYYRDYKYSGSVYSQHFEYNDSDIGKPIHERDEYDKNHVTDGELYPERAPHLNRPTDGEEITDEMLARDRNG